MTTLMGAVATATAAVPRLYPLGSVPASPVYPYCSYSAAFGRGDTFTNDGAEGIRWGRIVVQSFGKTADAAIDHAEKFRAALVGQFLTVTGWSSVGPITSELDPAVDRDPDANGVVSLATTLTFTATKE
jgi:hypothetical protein